MILLRCVDDNYILSDTVEVCASTSRVHAYEMSWMVA